MLNNNKAQSTLEYITVFTVIVAAIVILAYSKLQPAVDRMLEASSEKIQASAAQFQIGSIP